MAAVATTGLRPGWMVATAPAGVVVVGPDTEVTVAVGDGLDLSAELAAALAQPGTPAAAATQPGVPAEERERLVALLGELGAYGGGRAPAQGQALAAAIVAARGGAPPEGVVWTAEEALVLPPGLTVRTRTRALRAFVAGLAPHGRLEAYALLAGGRGEVHGDMPHAERLRERLREAGTGPMITVLELAEGGRSWSVAPGDLDGIGATDAHRLGPILSTSVPEPIDEELPELLLCVAEVSIPNLNVVAPRRDRAVQGVGTAAHARLVACAEGAERFAAGDPSSAELVRARRAELAGAIDPRTLYARAEPQDEVAAADEPRLWTPVAALDGTRRWVPAETVYLSLLDPAPAVAAIPWTSSGVAAGLSVAAATSRALCELVERDAFMVTWLRRASRERVAARGAPDDALRIRRVLARRGWATTWVNLTLDSFPVILCCLTHEQLGLTVGAACDAEPAQALLRATVEALVLALRLPADQRRPQPADVRTPRDHLLLHRDPDRRPDHEFLYASDDEIELGDVGACAGEDLAGLLSDLGHPPLTADLSLPACRPYRVVRALAPRLVPLVFGWRREPLGLPRVRDGVVTPTGHRPGTTPGPDPDGGNVPHPFP